MKVKNNEDITKPEISPIITSPNIIFEIIKKTKAKQFFANMDILGLINEYPK